MRTLNPPHGRRYDAATRDRIIALVLEGQLPVAVASTHGLSPATVYKWMKRAGWRSVLHRGWAKA